MQLAAPAAEYEPIAHGKHDCCPSRDWYWPAAQAVQCSADVTAPVPACCPAWHATHDACPPLAAYLPWGQPVQLSTFCEDEYVPAAHAAHARSASALGACTTCLPTAHAVCTRHALCPVESWNEFDPSHASHVTASSAAAYRPTAHSSHLRSALVVGAAASNVPLRQRCTLRHTVFPVVGWYWSAAHASHEVVPLAFWICPAAQGWQYAAASWFTAPEPKRPGSHASQKNAFVTPLCLPAGHARQLPAFSVAEKRPAAQSSHTPPPSTKVPGLQMPQYPSEAPPHPFRVAPPTHDVQLSQLGLSGNDAN